MIERLGSFYYEFKPESCSGGDKFYLFGIRSGLLKPPSLTTPVLIFLVKKKKINKMKLSGVPIFLEYAKRKNFGQILSP